VARPELITSTPLTPDEPAPCVITLNAPLVVVEL
jgi:hypothetical protein